MKKTARKIELEVPVTFSDEEQYSREEEGEGEGEGEEEELDRYSKKERTANTKSRDSQRRFENNNAFYFLKLYTNSTAANWKRISVKHDPEFEFASKSMQYNTIQYNIR